MQKRGLSEVIVSIIMVLLVLVAIGIVWVVVKNLISSGEENINLGFVTTSLKIENVKVNDENVEVRIKREAGEGEVYGLKFMIDDGVESQIFTENVAIKELETKRFELDYSGIVKEVSVSPIFKTESGKEKVGNVANTFKTGSIGFDNLKNDYGLVSWWRFEGNANDEIGGNNGNIIGGVNCNVDGKYGKACEFLGNTTGYINCGSDSSLDLKKQISIVAWAKPYSNEQGSYRPVASKGTYGLETISSSGEFGFWVGSNHTDTPDLPLNSWTSIVGVYDGNTIKIYRNGELGTSFEDPTETSGNWNFTIGYNQGSETPETKNFRYWNGTIDEVMVFDKALSDEEVKALYELELS